MQKYISLFVGTLGMFLAGVLYSFNTYAVGLKSTYNYTQSEVEFIAASGDLGQSILLFFVGVIFDKFGQKVACTVGLIFTGGGFTCLWIIAQFKTFGSARAWLVSLVQSVAMFGTAFSYLASVGVNTKNFEGKHKLKVLMSQACIFWNAPSLYSAIYQGFFVQGHIKDTENQKYGDFMLFLAVMSVIINLLLITLLKEIPNNESNKSPDESEMNELFETLQDMAADDKMENKHLNDQTSLIPNVGQKETTVCAPDLNGLQMMKTLPFYYLFLMLFILGGTGGTFVNNISTVLKSVHREYDVAVFTICIPIFCTLGILFIGFISNHISLKWPDVPRSSTVLPSAMLMCISLIVMILFYNGFAGLFSSAIMMSFAYAAFYVQIQWVIIHLFGSKYLGQNLGILLTAHGLGVFGLQQLFAFSYKLNSLPGSNECYGEECSKWTFILLALLCFCALFSNICLVKIERDTINVKAQETL